MRHKNIFSLFLNILHTKIGEDPACVRDDVQEQRVVGLLLDESPSWKHHYLWFTFSVREKGEINIGAGPTHHSPSPYTGEWIYFGSHSFSHVYDTNTKFKTKTKIKSPDLQGKRELNNTSQRPWMGFWGAKIAAASCKYLRLACVIKVIIIDI